MGQEITYCYGCQTRLMGSDFEKGQAFRVGAQVSCPACVKGLLSSLTPAQADAEVARLREVPVTKKGATSARIPAQRAEAPLPARPALPLAFVGGGILLLLIGLGFVMSSGRETRGLPPETPAPLPPDIAIPSPVPGPDPVAVLMADLDRALAARLAREDYAGAANDVEAARRRRTEPAWTAGIQERRARIEARAQAALPGLVRQAREADRPEETARLRGFIATFPSLAADFDRATERTPVPSPVPIPIPIPVPVPAAVPVSKAEAAKDPDLLQRAERVRGEGLAALAKMAKDQKVKLEVADGAAVLGSFEGSLLLVDAVRVRLATESGAIDLPVSELSAETIARLYAERPGHGPDDARVAAVWLAIGGDAEAARRLDATLPKQYDAARSAAAESEADAEARREFWIGFAEFDLARSRASGIQRLQAITSPRYRPFIDLLLERAKDFVFSGPELAATGAFAPAETEKVGAFWKSGADGKSAIEVEYFALPEQTYRAWVYAGGCCLEVFTFSMQMGDAAPQAVKLPSLPLKKIHSQHLGPKQPERWEWIPLTLPKVEAGGPRKLRLLSDEKGFSVAHVVVSATRRGPPAFPEIKELLKDRVLTARILAPGAPATGKPTKTAFVGGKGGASMEELARAGAVLVGFKYATVGGGRNNLQTMQAIYRLRDEETPGGRAGPEKGMKEIVAKPGYAVGQMLATGSDRLDGFKLVFMRFSGGRLLPGDRYESPWIGGGSKSTPTTLGDGAPVGGIVAKHGNEIDGYGLILLK